MSGRPRLFEAVGVELEYMIVDATTLDVRPCSDALIHSVVGRYDAEVELGRLAWSNELVLHVLELKTNGPAPGLDGLARFFQESVERAGAGLEALGARLMPTGMHPWMDPVGEMRLWPHEYSPVYEAYDRIFGCTGHGWANLQSTHLNLPFGDDEEFGRLHNAIRAVLPLIPALAAASPILDGRYGPDLDNRLRAYQRNSLRIPSVTGRVIPEPAATRREYEERILEPIYRDLEPLDPQGILRHEWVNSRGAIARFDRHTVEIRLVDAQESPRADLAVVAAVQAVVRELTVGRLADRACLDALPTEDLARVFDAVVRAGEEAWVDVPAYLEVLGMEGSRPVRAGEIWEELVERAVKGGADLKEWEADLGVILREGPLARRIARAVGPEPERGRVEEVYRRLCDCLRDGELFRALG